MFAVFLLKPNEPIKVRLIKKTKKTCVEICWPRFGPIDLRIWIYRKKWRGIQFVAPQDVCLESRPSFVRKAYPINIYCLMIFVLFFILLIGSWGGTLRLSDRRTALRRSQRRIISPSDRRTAEPSAHQPVSPSEPQRPSDRRTVSP